MKQSLKTIRAIEVISCFMRRLKKGTAHAVKCTTYCYIRLTTYAYRINRHLPPGDGDILFL